MEYLPKRKRLLPDTRHVSVKGRDYEYELKTPDPKLEKAERFIHIEGEGYNRRALVLVCIGYDSNFGYYAINRETSPEYDWQFVKGDIAFLPENSCFRIFFSKADKTIRTGECGRPAKVKPEPVAPVIPSAKPKYIAEDSENQEFINSLMSQFERRKLEKSKQ